MNSVKSPENNTTLDISLYELNRKPHELITDQTEISPPRSLDRNFTCPICLNILKNTVLSKECMHRFCSDCIFAAFRSDNIVKCVTCQTKFNPGSFSVDLNFDLLISKIYPSKRENETIQQNTKNVIHSSAREECIGFESSSSRENTSNCEIFQPSKFNEISCQTEDNFNFHTEGNINSRFRMDDEIELVLKPHPTEMLDELNLMNSLNVNLKRCIRTTANTTIDHLCKYIGMRLIIDLKEVTPKKPKLITVRITTLSETSHFVKPDGNQTLEQVHKTFFKENQNKPMELYYSWNIL